MAKKKAAPPVKRNVPSPQSLAWIESHPRFDVDPAYQSRVIAAHDGWLSRGGVAGTDEYVAFIDGRLRDFYQRDDHGSMVAAREAARGL